MGKNLKGKEIGVGIHQRQDGRYEIRFINRFGKRQSLYASSLVEARKKQSEALQENAEKRSVKKRYMLKDWYPIWMKTYKEPVIRNNTKRYYSGVIEKHILPLLGGMYLDEIQPMHIKQLLNDLNADGYQWSTQNKVKLLLSDLFNIAMENDFVLKNPAKGVRLPINKPTGERVVLSVEEQQIFFTCCAGTFYDNLFVTAVNTGLRPGEICALEESDIDFEKHQISVTKTLLYQKLDGDIQKEFHFDPPKTYTSKREVPLNRTAENALKKQIRLKKVMAARHSVSGDFANLLFTTRFNTPICSQVLNDAIKKITDEINLQLDDIEKFPEFSAHTFRHTFATRCIESGMQPKTLQKILGHATLEMTMNLYVHVTEEFESEEMEKLEDYMPTPDEITVQYKRDLHVVES